MSTAQAQVGRNDIPLNNVDHLWHLKKADLTRELSRQDLRTLGAACQDRIYAEGRTIYQPGQKADFLFLVNRGTVRLTVSAPGGTEKIVGLYGNGDVFGENVLTPGAVYEVQAIAHEESWLSVVKAAVFRELLVRLPQLAVNLARILNSKLGSARKEIERLSFETTEDRIVRTLSDLCAKYGRDIVTAPGFKKLTIPVTHANIAQLVGANRPHVSSILSNFKKEGLIRYRNRKILIHEEDVAALLKDKRAD